MEKFHLSQRLQHIANFLGDGRRIADIGTDHAYIPIQLAKDGLIDFAIASDVGAGPVAIATANVADNGLSTVIDVRLADGLAGIRPEDGIDTIFIAGMGGLLIQDILTAGLSYLDGTETLVLAPNRDDEAVRTWLAKHEFGILDEDLVEEQGHVYPIIVAGQTKPEVPYTEADLILGPVLRQKRSPLFLTELDKRIDKTAAVLKGLANAQAVPATKVADEQRRLALFQTERTAE
ncbi:tRNA (adenine(22)-N(1))-methyltransferase [Lacticaseibacillus daqingensis]|uniref:tRNA (adenine(22)-N(1))-methyltransferase n=1 Tax=Lacticaseibacillus daqingensis TaxID=2486014 RepID=UPI000F7926A4|nr:class I SAM-dependent methyltransferase [Lacticaseibacillus daqingensis]